MIVVENVILSDDIKDNFFACNINKCKGACCIEGDLGAPLTEEEVKIIADILPRVTPFLGEESKKEIKKKGTYFIDSEKEYSTNTINGKECVFAYYNNENILKCAFEKAYSLGKTGFIKPMSCHLYPLRVTHYDYNDAINYHRWDICNDACILGKNNKIPLYKFLKLPLIRKYGKKWYSKLLKKIKLKETS